MRWIGVLGPVALIGLLRCASDYVPIEPSWDGTDAGLVRDGTPTAAISQALPDAALPDAAPFDAAAQDGGLLRGKWKPIPGINNPICLMAEEPAASVPPLEWQPCAGNRPGCKKLKKTWTRLRGAGLGFGNDAEARMVRIGSALYLVHQLAMPDAPYRVDDGEWLNVIRNRDGVAVFASYNKLLNLDVCGAKATATDGKSILYAGIHRPPPVPTPPGESLRYTLRFDGASTLAAPLPTEGVPEIGGFVGTSTERTFHQLDLGGFAVFKPAANAWVQSKGEAAIVPFEAPMGVVGGAIGTHNNVPVGITYTDNDGNWTRVTSPVGERYTTGMALDRENQNRMYWIESNSFSSPTESVLYSAPFAKNAAELAANGGPKRITSFGAMNGRGGAAMIANAGVAVDLLAWDKAFVVRESDGKGWEIPAEPGEVIYQGIWVDDTEVWLETAVVPPGGLPENGISEEGILVIQRSSLGAPTLARK
jgi:hypothetical protein